ncbi:hypothetical protein C8Q74DRAFT_435638 [Fomes fomentarius]|nr:hypothetical protein C8Q74DRAFT_435638 [Fomes fomentarius]
MSIPVTIGFADRTKHSTTVETLTGPGANLPSDVYTMVIGPAINCNAFDFSRLNLLLTAISNWSVPNLKLLNCLHGNPQPLQTLSWRFVGTLCVEDWDPSHIRAFLRTVTVGPRTDIDIVVTMDAIPQDAREVLGVLPRASQMPILRKAVDLTVDLSCGLRVTGIDKNGTSINLELRAADFSNHDQRFLSESAVSCLPTVFTTDEERVAHPLHTLTLYGAIGTFNAQMWTRLLRPYRNLLSLVVHDTGVGDATPLFKALIEESMAGNNTLVGHDLDTLQLHNAAYSTDFVDNLRDVLQMRNQCQCGLPEIGLELIALDGSAPAENKEYLVEQLQPHTHVNPCSVTTYQ